MAAKEYSINTISGHTKELKNHHVYIEAICIPTIAIMKVSGHKTEKEFMKYIKITEEQTAMELMNHPYFSGR